MLYQDILCLIGVQINLSVLGLHLPTAISHPPDVIHLMNRPRPSPFSLLFRFRQGIGMLFCYRWQLCNLLLQNYNFSLFEFTCCAVTPSCNLQGGIFFCNSVELTMDPDTNRSYVDIQFFCPSSCRSPDVTFFYRVETESLGML